MGIATLGLLTVAQAQTFGLTSSTAVAVTNNGFDPLFIHLLNSSDSNTGAFVSTSGSGSYSGLNGAGESATMNFEGSATASAQYGIMKTYGHGRLENSFYNSENPIYYNSELNQVNPDGTPDRFISYGQAKYEDFFQYSSPTGNISAGVKVDFWYRIHGTLSGDAGYHSVFVENDGDYDYVLIQSDGGITQIDEIWTTKKFVIGADLALQHSATLLSQYDNISTEFWGDGQLVEGTADFDSTVTLGGMNLYDENDNLIGGWTMNSASGTDYQAVPEPATMTVLAIAAIAAIKRHKK